MATNPNPYEPGAATLVAGSGATTSPRSQLILPALLILVPSILHIFGGLFYFAFVYQMAYAPGADPLDTHTQTVYCLYYGITMLYCLLLSTGAYSMLHCGSYLWAMTVCILALVPFFGACYFFAIPGGIWGLVVLRRPDVRGSFSRL